MWPLIPYLLVGAGLGAAFGYFGKCASGTCPLRATWQRGAIYGALLGSLFYFVSGGTAPASMNQSTANVQLIQETNFDAEVIQSPTPVVADFYATWCGPCRILSPRLDRLSGSFTNEIKFVKINVDDAPGVAQRYAIQAIPTLLFFRDGRVVDRTVGLPDTGELEARLKAFAAAGKTSATVPPPH